MSTDFKIIHAYSENFLYFLYWIIEDTKLCRSTEPWTNRDFATTNGFSI